MAKFTPDATLDGMLAVIATATRVDVCSTQPTTYTQATTTYTLGNYTLTAGAGNGDWTVANGDTSGRKLTLGAQTGNNASANGTAAHLAFSVGTTLLHVTTVTSESTNSGSPLDISAVDVAEISDVA